MAGVSPATARSELRKSRIAAYDMEAAEGALSCAAALVAGWPEAAWRAILRKGDLLSFSKLIKVGESALDGAPGTEPNATAGTKALNAVRAAVESASGAALKDDEQRVLDAGEAAGQLRALGAQLRLAKADHAQACSKLAMPGMVTRSSPLKEAEKPLPPKPLPHTAAERVSLQYEALAVQRGGVPLPAALRPPEGLVIAMMDAVQRKKPVLPLFEEAVKLAWPGGQAGELGEWHRWRWLEAFSKVTTALGVAMCSSLRDGTLPGTLIDEKADSLENVEETVEAGGEKKVVKAAVGAKLDELENLAKMVSATCCEEERGKGETVSAAQARDLVQKLYNGLKGSVESGDSATAGVRVLLKTGVVQVGPRPAPPPKAPPPPAKRRLVETESDESEAAEKSKKKSKDRKKTKKEAKKKKRSSSDESDESGESDESEDDARGGCPHSEKVCYALVNKGKCKSKGPCRYCKKKGLPYKHCEWSHCVSLVKKHKKEKGAKNKK